MNHILPFHISQLKKILVSHFKKPVTIKSCTQIGRGWMATGYKLDLQIGNKSKQLVLRSISPLEYSHDYPSDQAGELILQHQSSQTLPNHIKSIAVIGIDKNKDLSSVNNLTEFFQIVEHAQGTEYREDLEKILESNHASNTDIKKAILLGKYLAKIHGIKFRGEQDKAASLYKRHLRDYCGSLVLLAALDTYPKEIKFSSWGRIDQTISEILRYRRRIGANPARLSRVHGDFHPGNIRFTVDNKLEILDSVRAIWGESAEDVATLIINYIWYAIRQRNEFSGPFADLLITFWESYLKESKDNEIKKLLPLFLMIRSFVVNHPLYFDVSNTTRKKIFKITTRFIKEKEFNLELLSLL